MWVATSGVKSGNCFSCFCSFAFWRIFHAAWRCVSLCFCRNVNHKAKAHLWPLRIPATPCRFSWPAEKATARPHSGFSVAWKLTSVCFLDWMSEFLSLRPLYLWQVLLIGNDSSEKHCERLQRKLLMLSVKNKNHPENSSQTFVYLHGFIGVSKEKLSTSEITI